MGTGKSTVARMFKELGAVVLDADALAHRAMEPKRLAWRRIVQTFGEGILNDDQTIHRRRLADLIFADAERRRTLERIIHPHVLREIKQALHRLQRARRVPAVVLDVPLLIESGAHQLADALVVVTAPADVQRERLKTRHGWSDDDIAVRMEAQLELSAKVALADYVVDNSDGVEATRTQVRSIWNRQVPAKRRVSKRSRASRSRRGSK